jgi:hypothetical protein
LGLDLETHNEVAYVLSGQSIAIRRWAIPSDGWSDSQGPVSVLF